MFLKGRIFNKRKIVQMSLHLTFKPFLGASLREYSPLSRGLRGGDCLLVPRFETRFMKDSLAYRGTVLWNTICLHENGTSHLSNKDWNLIRTKDYFKDFKFDTASASTTRHRNADFVYN